MQEKPVSPRTLRDAAEVTEKPLSEWSAIEVTVWLKSIKLGRYADEFLEEGISGELLVELDEDILRELGMTKKLHLLKFKKEIKKLISKEEDLVSSSTRATHQQNNPQAQFPEIEGGSSLVMLQQPSGSHSRTKTKEQAEKPSAMLEDEIEDVLLDDDDLPPDGMHINVDAAHDSMFEEEELEDKEDIPDEAITFCIGDRVMNNESMLGTVANYSIGVVQIFWDEDGRVESFSDKECRAYNIETFKTAASEKAVWEKNAKKRLQKGKWVGAIVQVKKDQPRGSAILKNLSNKNVTCSLMINVKKKVRVKWSRIFRPLFPPGSEVRVPRSKNQKGKQSLDFDYDVGEVFTRTENKLIVKVGSEKKSFKFCECIPSMTNRSAIL